MLLGGLWNYAVHESQGNEQYITHIQNCCIFTTGRFSMV